MKKKKVCIITGSRAEYGLLYWLMKAIEESEKLELQIIVTGMHLSDEFGNTYLQIEKDGFNIDKKVDKALSMVSLTGFENRMPGQLSGGQQQRVAVARAISGSRPLILADEPTGNLDVKSGEEILDLFQDLCKNDGISVLMVTHDPILASRADRMLLLKDGVTAASDIRSAWGIEELES